MSVVRGADRDFAEREYTVWFENLHIQGHYALWDGIIDYCRKNGKCTFVDSCASGGGRNDIESRRRGFPLMRSDYDRTTSGMRLSQTWGFCKWVPYHGSSTEETKGQLDGMRGKAPDAYVTRASLLPIWNWSASVTHDPECDLEGCRRNIALWKGGRAAHGGEARAAPLVSVLPHCRDGPAGRRLTFGVREGGDGAHGLAAITETRDAWTDGFLVKYAPYERSVTED